MPLVGLIHMRYVMFDWFPLYLHRIFILLLYSLRMIYKHAANICFYRIKKQVALSGDLKVADTWTDLNSDQDYDHPLQSEAVLFAKMIPHQICQFSAVLQLFIHNLQITTWTQFNFICIDLLTMDSSFTGIQFCIK